MASARALLSPAEWRAHCIELATEKHSNGTAYYLGKVGSDELFRIEARSIEDSYTVRSQWNGAYACNCIAGSYGKPCRHVGAAIHWQQARERACSMPSVAATSAYQLWAAAVEG